MDKNIAELPVRSVDDKIDATDSNILESNDSIDVHLPTDQGRINDAQVPAEKIESKGHMSPKGTLDEDKHTVKLGEGGSRGRQNSLRYARAEVSVRGLACPFAASDPKEYMSTDLCKPTEGFKEPRLLFEHVWRKHTRFYQCGFCSTRWSISTPRREIKQKKEKHWKSCDGKLRGLLYHEADDGYMEIMDWKQLEKIKSIRDVGAKLAALYKACGKPVPKTYYATALPSLVLPSSKSPNDVMISPDETIFSGFPRRRPDPVDVSRTTRSQNVSQYEARASHGHVQPPAEGHDHEIPILENMSLPNNPLHDLEGTELPSHEASPSPSIFESYGGQAERSISSVPFSEHRYKANSENDKDLDLPPPSVLYEDLETSTVYSDDSTISERSDMKEFEYGLARDLCSRLSSSHGADDAFLKKVLPFRLAEFARRLAAEGSPQIYRDIMVFVHKHRRSIASHFEEVAIAQGRDELDNTSNHNQDTSHSPNVQSWLAHTTSGGEEELVYPDETYIGVTDEDEDDDTTISPAGMEAYREVITGSGSYDWLISKLRCDLSCYVPGEDAREQISNCIYSHPALRRVSRRAPQPVFKAVYTVDWDLPYFLHDQDYGKHATEALWDALTLTGRVNESEGLACGDYICRTWPQSGAKFLELLESVVQPDLNSGHEAEMTLEDKTHLIVSVRGTNFELQASGVAETVAELGEQLAWICCALHSHTSPEAVRCIPTATVLNSGTSPPSININISRKLQIAATSGDQNGSCWKSLFQNPVLVEGYPIQRRPALGTGLELPLATMADLVQCERMNIFNQEIFLKGFCAMLVAVQMVGDVVQWHAYTNKDGSYMNYYDHKEAKETADLELLSHIKSFTNVRHVVGWSSNVRDNSGLGTAKYEIKGSGLKQLPGLQLAFDRINLGFSNYVTANISVALGTRDKPSQVRGRAPYFEQVRLVATKFVVLFDASDRKAWLVDGATALAHLLQASLVVDVENGINRINPHKSLHWPEAKPGEIGALKMLLHEENVNLELFKNPDEEDMKIETRRPECRQAGRPSRETGTTETRRQTWYRVRDRVSLIFSVLEELFNHQEDCRPKGVGFRIVKSSRKHLEGFGFYDVANGTGQIFPQAVSLEPHGCGWVDLARELRVITLFGRGFGELLQPTELSTHDSDHMGNGIRGVCSMWQVLPNGMDYLATTNSTLQRILNKHGDTDKNPWRIINEIYLHSPHEVFGRCRCAGRGCDRVQVPFLDTFRRKMLWGRYRSPSELPPSGAVIFGCKTKYSLKWGGTGDHLNGDMVEFGETSSDPSASSLTPTSASSVGGSVASPPSAVTPTSSETVSNGGVGSFIAVLRRKRRRGST